MWTLPASGITLIIAAQAVNDPLLEWLSRAGSLGLLATAVIAFLRGWIVPGKSYERVCLERDRALDLVYRQAEVAERAITVAEKAR